MKADTETIKAGGGLQKERRVGGEHVVRPPPKKVLLTLNFLQEPENN